MVDLPIDYLSDHLDSFEIGTKFVSGMGYLGIIRMNEKEVFRSSSFVSEMQIAFDQAVQHLEKNYQHLIKE